MTTKPKSSKTCKHKWTVSHTAWEFPWGMHGTAGPVEYAYFYCEECLKVVKKKVVQKR